jgi:hypothetical protein
MLNTVSFTDLRLRTGMTVEEVAHSFQSSLAMD